MVCTMAASMVMIASHVAPTRPARPGFRAFSQGGTTRSVSEKIAKGLNGQQFQVDLHDIVEGPLTDINSYDMIGIGSPVYIYRPPFKETEFIKSLPDLDGRPFFAFVLYGLAHYDTVHQL